MSFFLNNDPFWNFFENINDEVSSFNDFVNSQRPRQRQALAKGNRTRNQRQVTADGNQPEGAGSSQQLTSQRGNNKENNQGNGNGRLTTSSFFNDPFFNSVSPFDFNFDADIDIVPPVDIIDNEKNYDVHFSIPGAAKDHITIDFNKDDNELVVKGEIPEVESTKVEGEGKKARKYIERSSGKFERHIVLPSKADGDNIKAKFENGVLQLDVPKSTEEKANSKRIEIS
ncbi:hypothetical protein PACTADRAFT_2385 [Pachysolen tannophilus NRRL Y-2460]|uniref:SHSP domain-containing protein n=1 Tax=Pachysolen tannophilus NRRL Y-2460 TaxID=669874 RepID=A0A1E4TWH4_PACTA|nr:hypothetical protein PACTADRAFT_2385 [Pachysolen tannophilus NRRL Y-2460]